MTLPSLFPFTNNFDLPYRRTDGVTNPDQTIVEPGSWFDTSINDTGTANYPPVVQVTDYEITGTFNSTATWTITLTPVSTQSGTAASAHAMALVSVSYTATTQSAANTVIGINAAINLAITTIAGAYGTGNMASYVVASVGATTAKVRLTARTPNFTFTAAITSTLAGDGYTATAIASPVTGTIKPGLYYALDTTKGTNGYDAAGHPYITAITSSTAPANIIGPIYKGTDTQPVARGFAYREYVSGQNIPYAKYGHISAYADKAIPLSSGPEVVYVRHTTAGDYLAGMASDATGAAAAATIAKWTGTPALTNSALYVVTIAFGNETVVLQYTADGSAADTEIVAGLKLELAKYNAAGGPLYGITATSATTTLVLDGPADGREFTPVTTSAGAVTWVHTTTGVSTHTRLTRGDKFIGSSTRIGPSRVAVPVTPLV